MVEPRRVRAAMAGRRAAGPATVAMRTPGRTMAEPAMAAARGIAALRAPVDRALVVPVVMAEPAMVGLALVGLALADPARAALALRPRHRCRSRPHCYCSQPGRVQREPLRSVAGKTRKTEAEADAL